MHKILIIEDEEAILKPMEDFLKELGYEAFGSLNGNTGLGLIKAENPEILILELYLKGPLTGRQVLRMAKTQSPDLKVIVITGFGKEEELEDDAVFLGINAILYKPFPLKELTGHIDRILKTE